MWISLKMHERINSEKDKQWLKINSESVHIHGVDTVR